MSCSLFYSNVVSCWYIFFYVGFLFIFPFSLNLSSFSIFVNWVFIELIKFEKRIICSWFIFFVNSLISALKSAFNCYLFFISSCLINIWLLNVFESSSSCSNSFLFFSFSFIDFLSYFFLFFSYFSVSFSISDIFISISFLLFIFSLIFSSFICSTDFFSFNFFKIFIKTFVFYFLFSSFSLFYYFLPLFHLKKIGLYTIVNLFLYSFSIYVPLSSFSSISSLNESSFFISCSISGFF